MCGGVHYGEFEGLVSVERWPCSRGASCVVGTVWGRCVTTHLLSGYTCILQSCPHAVHSSRTVTTGSSEVMSITGHPITEDLSINSTHTPLKGVAQLLQHQNGGTWRCGNTSPLIYISFHA